MMDFVNYKVLYECKLCIIIVAIYYYYLLCRGILGGYIFKEYIPFLQVSIVIMSKKRLGTITVPAAFGRTR